MNGTPCPCQRLCIHWLPVLIATIVISVAILLGWYYPAYIQKNGAPGKWIGLLEPEITNAVLQLAVTKNTTSAQTNRMQEQAVFVGCRAQHHFQVMNYYLTTYYTDLLLGSVFGGVSAISLLLITRRGWDNSGGCLISLMLSTAVCTTFFFAFPRVCQMNEMAKANKVLYLRYVALLNDARTFAATGKYAGDEQTNVSTEAFILHVDSEVKKVGDIAVSFDPAKVPIYEFSKEPTKQ